MRCRPFTSHAVGLAAVLLLATACVDGAPASATTAPQPAPVPVAPPIAAPPAFPALARPGQIFRAPDNLYDAYATYHQSSLGSRYVLFDDGTFTLQFSSARFGFFEYLGHYSNWGSWFTFMFDADDRWGAFGVLSGDALSVKYTQTAMLSDFVEGAYVRPEGPHPIVSPPPFPALSRAGQVYRAPNSLYDPYLESVASRYVVYDDGTFTLQFSSARSGFWDFPGHYTAVDSVLTFSFNDGRWGATGVLSADAMSVRYNDWASMYGLLDGAYVRSEGH